MGGRIVGRRPYRVVATVVATLLLVVALFPIYWMISSSVKSNTEILTSRIVPSHIVVENYTSILERAPVIRWFANSLLVGVGTTSIAVFLSLLAAYSLGRLRFPGRGVLFLVVLSGFMIPIHSIMIPLFIMLGEMGLGNSYGGLLLPLVVHPVSVLVLTQYFRGIEQEFEDAARLDGAGEFQILFRIMTPMAVPAIATVSIFIFTYSWNEFLWPLLIAQTDEMYTLPVGLATLAGGDINITYGPIMAANVMASLPVFLVYAIFQRYIVAGIAMETR
ncbi:MAG: carbohydrate ABC transporter permease [Spirochaetales bacterium]|nr:carbohydrate ABC transporter permease [Spirochaetales bacterium]